MISIPAKDSLSVLFPAPVQMPVKAALVACVVAMVGYASLISTNAAQIAPVPLEKPLAAFPMQVEDWTGRMSLMDKASLDILGTEDYLLADFTNREGDSVNFYMLYFPKQDSTNNQAVHTPEVCIPSGGWEIVSHVESAIELENGVSQSVNKLIIAKGLQRHLVYYWFFQGEQTTLNEISTRASIIKRSFFEHRSDGGMIRLTTPIDSQKGTSKEEEKLKKFFADVVKSRVPLR